MNVFKATRTLRCETAWRHSRSGFSIIEAVMVLVIVGTVLGALAPSVARQLSRARVNRAATVIAADFYMAQALAGRMRAPVTMSFDPNAKATRIVDPVTAAILLTRRFGPESEFRLTSYSASQATVLVLPNGMSSATITVRVGNSFFNRQVTMSRAGQIRVSP